MKVQIFVSLLPAHPKIVFLKLKFSEKISILCGLNVKIEKIVNFLMDLIIIIVIIIIIIIS